ncbi:YbhN family protein [Vulgatibacter sp.]|uniref:lysylphosphatidylglycerol synthase transmembrane domain-containing protein n=1 Tax=Vulgatibacter sp. TaxID=1971226 RepID=UPI00356ACB39
MSSGAECVNGAGERRRDTDARKGGSLFWRVFFGVVVLLGLAWLVANRSEGAEFLAILQNAQPWWLLVAAALQVFTYPVDGIVWQRVLARLPSERNLRIGTVTRLALAKFFVDQFVPGGGVGGTVLVMRSMEKRGVSRDGSMVGLLARLVSYYFAYAVALAAAVGIAWWVADKVPRVILGAASGLALIFLLVPGLLLWGLRHRERRLPQYLLRTRLLKKARPTIDSMTRVAPAVGRDRGMLLESTAWQFVIFVLDGATLWAMLHAVGIEASLPVAYASFLLGFLAGSLGFVPAGVGIFEAGTVASLTLLGVPGPAALTATLLFRGFSLWLPLAPGAFYARRESWR